MGSQVCLKVLLFGFCFWLSSRSSSSLSILQAEAAGSAGFVGGNVFIDRRSVIGRTDDDFVCATLDWWPPEKCDYGTCSWDRASLLNLVLLLSFSCFGFLISLEFNRFFFKWSFKYFENVSWKVFEACLYLFGNFEISVTQLLHFNSKFSLCFSCLVSASGYILQSSNCAFKFSSLLFVELVNIFIALTGIWCMHSPKKENKNVKEMGIELMLMHHSILIHLIFAF